MKHKKHLLSSSKKNELTRTSESVRAIRTEQTKETKFELGLMKTVDWFLNGDAI